MANWKNAPLVYTLGMVQFPKVPNIERFVDSFHDRIRGQYPLPDQTSIPILSANIGALGLQFSQQESKLWQYLSVDKKSGFILNDSSLCLHTVQYHDSVDFKAKFKAGLEALLGVPSIGIEWVTALGIRYVDLVVPRDGESLKDYLETWLLPAELPHPDMSLTIQEGAYVARYKTELGELRLQALRNPPFTLPQELQNPLLALNNWAKERPQKDFALVDTDHGVTYATPISIDVEGAVKTLDALHLLCKKVFESMGTDHAIKVWQEEKK